MQKIVLEAKHLSKSYNNIQAVKDLSFAVEEGEVFGFLGPNGAGKTTTINMLCGLMKPDNGEVLSTRQGSSQR
ncbi:MAG: ATP-binding cassette domain-containing protein [Anaerolineaceae bacterium]